jgi:hypothetical protein
MNQKTEILELEVTEDIINEALERIEDGCKHLYSCPIAITAQKCFNHKIYVNIFGQIIDKNTVDTWVCPEAVDFVRRFDACVSEKGFNESVLKPSPVKLIYVKL